MDDYAEEAGRLLADRYRLPRPLSASYQLTESVAYDTASGQEVLVRQIPLPEVVEAEVVGAGAGGGPGGGADGAFRGSVGRATRTPADPVVRRAVEAAIAAARLPDHPRLDQVFDVFVEGDGLWIVSELLPATPLATLMADQTLTAHRAAEIAADLLTALRVVHAHGWTHRNVTPHTVLICDDGRALLTGLAVGAAQEALCGYDPLPDTGRVALPPRGGIPGEPRPGGGDAGAGGGKSLGAGRSVTPTAGQGTGVGAPEAGTRTDAGGALSGVPLPEGFDARQQGDHRGNGLSGDRRDSGGQGSGGYGSGEAGPDERGGPRGIFGLQGLGHEGGTRPGPSQPPPVRHGYETGGRGPRAGAVAAYQEGARRGAAARAYVEDGEKYGPGHRPDEGWQGGYGHDRHPADGHGQGSPEGHGPPRRDGTEEDGARDDWWNRASTPPPPDDAHAAPDDFVRWLPAGEDEVTPSDLPGSRPPNSVPVKATWRSSPAEPEQRPGSAPEADAAGDAPGVPDEESPYGETPYGEAPNGGDRYGDPYAEGSHGQGTYAESPYGDDESAGDPYDEDLGSGEADSRPWGGETAGGAAEAAGFNGPATALEAERARQARMTVVGAVCERWAPEQAGPVHSNWRLAPPVGPSADLWALGVLLFRAVQGHAPYPEDDVAELVQMVCGEPPAFAEECGALRPVVESLLRQDPTERPDFEELRGWLRSLVRSAPEPEMGWHTVYAGSLDPGGTSDPRRLPILRRRGELVRRKRAARRAARAGQRQQKQQQTQERQARQPKPARQPKRPKQGRGPRSPQPQPPTPLAPAQAPVGAEQQPAPPQPQPYAAYEQTAPAAPPKPARAPRPAAARKRPREGGASPRRLGGLMVGLVLAGLVAALMYAVWFMPQGDTNGASSQQRGEVGGDDRPAGPGADGDPDGQPDGSGGAGDGGGDGNGGSADKQRPPAPTGKAPKGYKISRDPAGFQVAVPEEWNRRSTPGHGQVRYNGGSVEIVVVNGRDSVAKFGKDPMAYQSDDERELNAYRASDWASTSGLRRIDVGERAMAEGTFSWKDGGRDVYARNRAMILDGRYHVLMVIGSKSRQQEIDRHFEAVADTYRATRR